MTSSRSEFFSMTSDPNAVSWSRETFTVTCDPARLDLAVIAEFLASSYWAKQIPVETVAKSLEHSLCFALLDGDR